MRFTDHLFIFLFFFLPVVAVGLFVPSVMILAAAIIVWQLAVLLIRQKQDQQDERILLRQMNNELIQIHRSIQQLSKNTATSAKAPPEEDTGSA